jgi:glycosyltransferase involved in cell wall biosynthesis
MKVCAISFKECWQDEAGNWLSSGGFPLQMAAVGSLFDEMTLLIVGERPQSGGLPLPQLAHVVPLRKPSGQDTRRKLAVLMNLPYYLGIIVRHVRSADVIHTPLPGDLPFLGMLVALALRKRLIARYGGSWTPTSQTTFMNRVTRACMRLFAGGRNVMFATGEEEVSPAPEIDWIFATALSHGEIERIHPTLDRGLANPPRLVYAGRLSEEKGVASLIQAVALLKQEGFMPLPMVTLAGDGPQRDHLVDMTKDLQCEQLIVFAGQLDRMRLSEEFNQMDLCVQPSLTEGFSKAWLDAMAHGLPVIASEVGAARSVIGASGERGWLAPAGDVQALATILRHVLTATIDWPALRTRCRTYVEERTLETWAQQIAQRCVQLWQVALVEGKLRS